MPLIYGPGSNYNSALSNPNASSVAFGGRQSQSTSTSESGPRVIPEMLGIYQDTLKRNQQNYNNMLDAYSTGQQRLAATLPNIYSGYDEIRSRVGDVLGYGGKAYGVLNPEMIAENQKAAQQSGALQQQLINRGLGNTSVLGNMLNQNEYFRQLSMNDIGARLAQMYAGSEERIGGAKQQAQMQGLGQQTGLSEALGRTLGSYRWDMPGPLVGNYSTSTSQSIGSGGGPSGGGYGGGVGSMGAPKSGSYKSGLDYAPYAGGGGDTGTSYRLSTGGGGGSSLPVTGLGTGSYGSVALNNTNPLDYFPPGPFVTPMDDTGGGDSIAANNSLYSDIYSRLGEQ